MSVMTLNDSPVELIRFRCREFYIKRDDLLHPTFSGNKARKFLYYLENEFPNINRLISYGSAQANSLYSFSSLAKLKDWNFDYYVDHISSYMKDNPRGNYRAALENGANIIEVNEDLLGRDMQTYLEQEILPRYADAVFVPEGGRCQQAAFGVELLAEEIIQWAQEHNIDRLKVVLPSGTGTTALFLQRHFRQQQTSIEVLTCACVGGGDYVKKQFLELEPDQRLHPEILPADKKYHFGKLYDDFYTLWQELYAETGIEFELLYDPLGWKTLLTHLKQKDLEDIPVMYIHQGGVLGNETMLPRYQRREKNRQS